MKISNTEQEALAQLLTRIYQDILAIEEEFHLLAGEGDFRPRIEYFHDAVRAFYSQDPAHREAGGRLSVELLAYDVGCLRYIQSMPLAPFKPQGGGLSAHTDILKTGPGLMARPNRPNRAVRERITELYQHYAVLFAALLKPFADKDYQERVDDLNQDVEEINSLNAALDGLLKGSIGVETVAALANHLEEDRLRGVLLAFLAQARYQRKDEMKKMMQALKTYGSEKDKQIAGIEKAHMNFAMAQLGIYENSKDLLKKMAGQGMNLVGKFVEASMADTRKQMGRS